MRNVRYKLGGDICKDGVMGQAGTDKTWSISKEENYSIWAQSTEIVALLFYQTGAIYIALHFQSDVIIIRMI